MKCIECNELRNCIECNKCFNCYDCYNCTKCTNCRKCENCKYCFGLNNIAGISNVLCKKSLVVIKINEYSTEFEEKYTYYKLITTKLNIIYKEYVNMIMINKTIISDMNIQEIDSPFK